MSASRRGRTPVALTIAGSDPGGGAGVQADLKTFAALEVYGFSAITALTVQSTTELRAVHAVPPSVVRAQIEVVLDDCAVRVAKTGMLCQDETVEVVATVAKARGLTLVVDPVAVSEKGPPLTERPTDVLGAIARHLLGLAAVVTPNLLEVEAWLGARPRTIEDMVAAARTLVARGARGVVVKGGHLEGDPADVLVESDETVTVLHNVRIDSASTHGTGCSFASALAAHLARGEELRPAVAASQAFVRDAIAAAPSVPDVGRGVGPLHHLHPFYAWPQIPDWPPGGGDPR